MQFLNMDKLHLGEWTIILNMYNLGGGRNHLHLEIANKFHKSANNKIYDILT